jgi:toxin HigB-1
MIVSFGDKATEEIFRGLDTKRTRRFPPEVVKAARRRLDWLNAADSMDDLSNNPGAGLHKLSGNVREFYAVRINDQFRLIFKWRIRDAEAVEVIDYH